MDFSVDIRNVVASSISCIFKDEYIGLKSRFGKIVFDLSRYEFDYITLIFQKKSGNGRIFINKQLVTVTSKIEFRHELVLDEPRITINRLENGLGEVRVLGIILHINEEKLSAWKSILSRCESYKCLTMSGGKLLASQGGYISNESAIKTIETNPSGSYSRENGKIKFNVSCEITKLEIDTSAPIVRTNADIFVARTASEALLVPQELKRAPLERPAAAFARQKHYRPENMTNPVLYDSNAVREFNPAKFSAQDKPVKAVRSNNVDYLIVKRGGIYSIPATSFIRPNFEYVAIITAKKLNGNGRIQVGINPGGESNIIVDSDMMEHYVSVKSGAQASDRVQLTVGISDNGIGEVIISRIQLIEGIQLFSFRNKNPNDKDVKMHRQSYEVAKTLSSLSVQYGAAIDETTLDEVARTTKKYSRQRIVFGVEDTNISINGTVLATTFSGISWLNKVTPFFPTVRVQRSLGSSDLDVCITDKHNIIPAPKVWLEPFDTLNASQLDKLRNVQMVVTPSQPNANFLDSRLPHTVVVHSAKPLPFVPPQEVKYFKDMDYVVAFHRNEATTKRLIAAWDDNMPRLVLIGARGSYPSFVVPVNEYVDYQKTLYILLESKCVVDLPPVVDYESAMLHFVTKAGMPVVSSNWYVMSKPNCDFILTNEKQDDVKVPSIDNLKSSIMNAVERKRQSSDLENYNQNLNTFMSLLMRSS